jgi:dCTP deaminase
MQLSDGGIAKAIQESKISISSFDIKSLQPASYDLHLSNDFKKVKAECITPYVEEENVNSQVVSYDTDQYILSPGEFILSSTVEKISLNNEYAAKFEGKSSLGRIGLATHVTAGFIDPGFQGNITVEIKNEADYDIKLYAGMPIGQICFELLDTPALHAYGSNGKNHYQNQSGTTISWGIQKDKEENSTMVEQETFIVCEDFDVK